MVLRIWIRWLFLDGFLFYTKSHTIINYWLQFRLCLLDCASMYYCRWPATFQRNMLHPFLGLKWVVRMQHIVGMMQGRLSLGSMEEGEDMYPDLGQQEQWTGGGKESTLLHYYITTWHHNPGNYNLNTHCHESWKLDLDLLQEDIHVLEVKWNMAFLQI
jgi:hypothetical protein